MKSIAIIGMGQIGRRHMQALIGSTLSLHIDMMDPSAPSREEAQRMWKTLNPENSKKGRWVASLEDLDKDYDVVIVATSADVRAHLVKALLERCRIRFLILEKFLFQKESDFHDIQQGLDKTGIPAWVNCARRMQPMYLTLKKEMLKAEVLQMSYTGRNWGIACNAIHFVDLLCFLKETQVSSVDASALLPEAYPTKREGFFDVRGMLRVAFQDGSCLQVVDDDNHQGPAELRIAWGQTVRIMDESQLLYQSELTQLVVQDLIQRGSCALTPFAQSCAMHVPLLKAFRDNWKLGENDLCPIT